MTICEKSTCDHSAPVFSPSELTDLKSQQHTANNEQQVLSYSQSTGTLVPWAFPRNRRDLKRGPPRFLSLSTMYREWANKDSAIPALSCYCGRHAQMGYTNVSGGKYYFTCHCFNPRLDDTWERNASNKCGFKVSLWDPRSADSGESAIAEYSSPSVTPAGTPRKALRALPRSIGNTTTPRRLNKRKTTDDPAAVLPLWGPQDYREHPSLGFGILRDNVQGLEGHLFRAMVILCPCGQWVTQRRLGLHKASYCSLMAENPRPPSPPAVEPLGERLPTREELFAFLLEGVDYRRTPSPEPAPPTPLKDTVFYEFSDESWMSTPMENPINVKYPSFAFAEMDSKQPLGISNDSLLRVVQECSCGRWVALLHFTVHTTHFCEHRH